MSKFHRFFLVATPCFWLTAAIVSVARGASFVPSFLYLVLAVYAWLRYVDKVDLQTAKDQFDRLRKESDDRLAWIDRLRRERDKALDERDAAVKLAKAAKPTKRKPAKART